MMLRTLGTIAGALAAGAVVLGCTRALPAPPEVQLPHAGVLACAGVGLDAFLHGDPTDPSTAWLLRPDGSRQDVLFPPGYTAVFSPGLQIVDPAGKVAMAEGDYVYGACVGPGDKLTVAPEESFAFDCGPVRPEACRANAPSVASNQPGRSNGEVRAVRFTSADGDYVATFEDGTTIEGTADLGR